MSKEYDDFMRQYKKDHECCPKCGGITYGTTLAKYVLNLNEKENYQDLNRCVCLICSYKHRIHERVKRKK